MTSFNTRDYDTDTARSSGSETHRARFSPQQGPALSILVVETVADALDADPLQIPTLHEVIDADALERLFAPAADGTLRAPDELSFRYAGCAVTISGDGTVEVTLLRE